MRLINKIKYRLFTFGIISIPFLALGKQEKKTFYTHEFKVYIKNSLYLNNVDLSSGSHYTQCKDAFNQNIGFDYTKFAKRNLLLTIGVEMGYQRYNFILSSPYNDHQYSSYNTGGAPNIDKTIYYYALNIHFGYRFNNWGKFKPEIKFGGKLQSAFNGINLYSSDIVNSGDSYVRTGNLGKLSSFSAEMINFIYIGCKIPSQSIYLSNISIGFEAQKKLLFENNPFNYFTTTFTNPVGVDTHESFSGHQMAISLIIGYKL
jgi:hypothetical protein